MENIEIYKCECGKEFSKKCSLSAHKTHCKLNPNYEKNKEKFSKRMSEINKKKEYKKEFFTCPFCKKEWETTNWGFSYHKKYCNENPNKDKLFWKEHKHTEEEKKKISESMKKAHKEGRAYIWKHRVTEPSYPEKFLMEVLKNELNMENGKDYLREMPFNGFFLDFCWPEKKVVIEMDGEQHQRFQEQIERDKRKDDLLEKAGYRELRIPWQDCFHNPKKWIKKIKSLFK